MTNRRELEYFRIDGAVGGSQEWFCEWSMYFGGCAAVTACDLCLHLALFRGREELYPFDLTRLDRREYIAFGRVMKPYLRPRANGVNTLALYTGGLTAYWRGRGVRDLSVEEVPGTLSADEGWEAVRGGLDRGIPVPFLLLRHRDLRLKDYIWHWFILAGYEEAEGKRRVRVVTYGEEKWLDFDELWDTGFREKGGAILVRETGNTPADT